MNNSIKVHLGLYSGLQNPTIDLSEELSLTIVEKIQKMLLKESDGIIPEPKLGEYYGVRLEIPETLSKKFNAPLNIYIFNGSLSAGSGKHLKHYSDTEGIEKTIIKLAYEQGHQAVLEKLKAPNPR